ncbi:MAG: hypothetical protein AAFY26_14315 [Cyanobacteria bacterium J06638_22]
MSQKYALFADRAAQLQQRGVSRKSSLLLLSSYRTVSLQGEWLEAFWCTHCQRTTWYHVCKTGDRTYSLSAAPRELWQQVHGVVKTSGNPSVSEFTKRQSRSAGHNGIKDFQLVRG